MAGHGASGLEGEWLFKASLVDLTTKIVIVRFSSYHHAPHYAELMTGGQIVLWRPDGACHSTD